MNRLYKTYLFLRRNVVAALKTLFHFYIPLKLKFKQKAVVLSLESNLIAPSINISSIFTKATIENYNTEYLKYNILVSDIETAINLISALPITDITTNIVVDGLDFISNLMPVANLDLAFSLVDFNKPLDFTTKLLVTSPISFASSTIFGNNIIDLPSDITNYGSTCFLLNTEIDYGIDVNSGLIQAETHSFYTITSIAGVIDTQATTNQYLPDTAYTTIATVEAIDLKSIIQQVSPIDFSGLAAITKVLNPETILSQYSSLNFTTTTSFPTTIDQTAILSSSTPIDFIAIYSIGSGIDTFANIDLPVLKDFTYSIDIDNIFNNWAFDFRLPQLSDIKPVIDINSKATNLTVTNLEEKVPTYIPNILGVGSKVLFTVADMQITPSGIDILNTIIPLEPVIFNTFPIISNYSDIYVANFSAVGSFIVDNPVKNSIADITTVELGTVGSIPFRVDSFELNPGFSNQFTAEFGPSGMFSLSYLVNSYSEAIYSNTIWLDTDALPQVQLYKSLPLIAGYTVDLGRVPIVPSLYVSPFLDSSFGTNFSITGSFDLQAILGLIACQPKSLEFTSIWVDTPYSCNFLVKTNPIVDANYNIDTSTNVSLITNYSTLFADTTAVDIFIEEPDLLINFNTYNLLDSSTDITAIGNIYFTSTLDLVAAPKVDLEYAVINNTILSNISYNISNYAPILASSLIRDTNLDLPYCIFAEDSLQFNQTIKLDNISPKEIINFGVSNADAINFSIINTNSFNATFCYITFAKLIEYQSNIYTLGSMRGSTMADLSYHRFSY